MPDPTPHDAPNQRDDQTLPPSPASDSAESRESAHPVNTPRFASDDQTLVGGSAPAAEPFRPRTTPEIAQTIDMMSGAQSQLPRQFGDYELIQEIARGGMGVVFKAKQSRLNRIVAIKMILSGQLASEEDIRRFYAEAEAAANLEHPGIVPIFEVGHQDHQHFFSMGFVDGPSLEDLIHEKPLAAPEAALITKQVSEAVAYAHSRGVIHRDLKPANVLMSASESGSNANAAGCPRVTDFGLAKNVEGQSELTATGQVIGTPGYMPPEQAAGKIDEIDELADVYSLGGILYALLTGRAPFQSASPIDTLVQVLEQEPVSPRQLNSNVPKDLETICLKCLHKEKKRRYQSAQHLIEDLERYLGGSPIEARPVTFIEKFFLWSKKHPAVATLAATTSLLLLTLLIGAPLVALQQAQLKNAESIAKNKANEANAELAQSKTEAEASHYAANISLAYGHWKKGSLKQARQLLNEAPLDFRGWEWWLLNQLCRGDALPLHGHTANVSSIRFDSSLRTLAATNFATARRWNTQSGFPTATLPLPSANIHWNRNATRCVSILDERVLSLTWPDIELEYQFHRIGMPVSLCAPALDAPTIAILRKSDTSGQTTSDDWMLDIADPVAGKILASATELPRASQPEIAISPSGKTVVYSVDGHTLLIWDARDNWRQHRLSFEAFQINHVGFSPATTATENEEWLTLACSDHAIRIYRPQSKPLPEQAEASSFQPHRLLRSSGSEVTAIAWDTSGQWLAVGSRDKLVSVWRNLQPNTLQYLRGAEAEFNDLSFSLDSSHIGAATKFGIHVWPLNWQDAKANANGGTGWARGNSLPIEIPITNQSLTRIELAEEQRVCIIADDQNRHFLVDTTNWNVQRLRTRAWLDGKFTSTVEPLGFSPGLGTATALSADGSKFAFVVARFIEPEAQDEPISVRSSIVVWDVSQDKPISVLGEHDNIVSSLHFTNDGQNIVAATALTDKHEDHIRRVCRSTERLEITPNKLQVWSLESGQTTLQLAEQLADFTALDVSPHDNQLIVGGETAELKILDLTTGAEVRVFQGPAQSYPSDIYWLWKQDGDMSKDSLIVAGVDGRIRTYDALTGKLVHTLEGHSQSTTSISAFPSNDRIFSASEDSTLRIWSTDYATELVGLEHQGSSVNGVRVHESRGQVLSVANDGKLRVWESLPKSLPNFDGWETIDGEGPAFKWRPSSGKWEFVDNKLICTTQTIQQIAGLGELAGGSCLLENHFVPDACSLNFSVVLKGGAGLQLMFQDFSEFDGEVVELLSSPNPFTQRMGVSIYKQAGPRDLRESTGNPLVTLESNVQYEVRIVRNQDFISVYLNEDLVLHTRMACTLNAKLTLQYLYGQVDSVCVISDLMLRSPKDSLVRRDVMEQIESWLAEDLVISRVEEKIAKQNNWSIKLRKFASNRVRALTEDSIAIEKKLDTLLAAKTPSLADNKLALQLGTKLQKSRASVANTEKLAIIQIRTGDFKSALATLKTAFKKSQSVRGFASPTTWALLSICQSKLGNASLAETALHRANRHILLASARPRNWQYIQGLLDDEFGSTSKANGLLDSEQELIELVLGRSANEVSTSSGESLYAENFRFSRSIPTAPQTTITIGRDDWLKIGNMQASSGLVGFQNLSLTNVEVRTKENLAAIRFDTVKQPTELEFRGAAWIQGQTTLSLIKEADNWKIAGQQDTLQTIKKYGRTFTLDKRFFEEHTSNTNQSARTPLQKREQILSTRERFDPKTAHSLAIANSQSPDATARDWMLRGLVAIDVGNTTDAEMAAKQAIELDPTIKIPKIFESLLASERQPFQREAIGVNSEADIPTSWQRIGKDAFVGAGDFQAGWMIESPQAVLVLRMGNKNLNPDVMSNQVLAASDLLKRKILNKEEFTHDGWPALRFDFEGRGNGGMIDGRGQIPTKQAVVCIFRSSDVMMLTAVGPAENWSELDLQFTQMINSAQFTNVNSAPEDPQDTSASNSL